MIQHLMDIRNISHLGVKDRNYMKIAVVDDQIKEIATLCDLLSEYASSTGLSLTIDRFESGEDLLSGYRPYQYAAIFLDIYMNGISGIDTARSIRGSDPEALIVFMTSSSDHMSEAFDVHAFQYLIKTPDKEDLRQTLSRLMDDILRKQGINEPVLSFTWDREDHKIPFSDIVYVRSSNHNVEIMDSSNKAYIPRITYAAIYDKLSSDSRFLQINRGILVNIDRIVSFSSAAAPNVCRLEGDYCFPINIREKKSINEIRQNYIFNKMHKKMDEATRQRDGSFVLLKARQ